MFHKEHWRRSPSGRVLDRRQQSLRTRLRTLFPSVWPIFKWAKMGKRTGNPRGRPKGAKNQHTKEREEAVQEAAARTVEELGLHCFQGDSHALLMLVYKDTRQPLELRLDAAKSAIGYEKPKLSSVDANHSGAIGQYAAQPIPVEEREPHPKLNGHA